MGIRVEWIAIAMIMIMLGVSFLFEAEHRKAQNIVFNKEFEVHNSVTVEVDQKEIKSTLYSDYGMKENGVLTLFDMTYVGASVEKLRSKEGRFIDNKIYLDGNVTALQTNGYYYEGEHAIYNQLTEFLLVTSPFTAYVNNSVIKGINLKYDRKAQVARAQNVHAVFYPKK
jgi:hypothetical protein